MTKLAFVTLAVLIAAFTLAGCSEAIHNSGEDNAFIRVPGVDSGPTAPPISNIGSLMPARQGSVWRNKITVRTAGQNINVNSQDQGQAFQTLYERAVCKKTVSVPGGGTNVLIDVQPEKPNVSLRTELYQVNTKGIFLSRVTGDQEFSVNPAIPLILAKGKANQIYKWSGNLELAKKIYPAQGYSRLQGLEKINEKDKKTAWRVDTVIIANADGHQTGFLMSRWFEPGVGIVRQRFYAGDKKVWKELVTYKP